MTISKTDIAYEILSNENRALSFYDLWKEICSRINISEDNKDELMSMFYTDLSVDGRFITLGENTWDLRENHSFDKVHIDMNDIYSDDNEIIEAEEGLIIKEDTEEELFEEKEIN